jgi:hypothetical protein
MRRPRWTDTLDQTMPQFLIRTSLLTAVKKFIVIVEGASVVKEVFVVLSPVFNLRCISVVVLSTWL